MNFTVAKKDLVKIVARMRSVTEAKGTLPMLAFVLLQAEDGALRLSATDLYHSLSATIPAEVHARGSLALPAKDLLERVQAMPDGPITLEAKESAAIVKAKGCARRYTLRGQPAADFPPLAVAEESAPRLVLGLPELRALIAATHYAISNDGTRPHLNSALFEWEGETLRMVATDGHRLAKKEMKSTGRAASTTMLIGQKAIGELRRICEEPEDGAKAEVEIVRAGSTAFFRHASATFSVKLVDAAFPPYAQVIPKTAKHEVKVSRAVLADALRAVSVASTARAGGVKMTFKKGAIEVTAESPESGDGADSVPIQWNASPITVGLNAKYLLDVLGAIEEDTVVLAGLGDELDPILVLPEEDKSFVSVLMPMRVM